MQNSEPYWNHNAFSYNAVDWFVGWCIVSAYIRERRLEQFSWLADSQWRLMVTEYKNILTIITSLGICVLGFFINLPYSVLFSLGSMLKGMACQSALKNVVLLWLSKVSSKPVLKYVSSFKYWIGKYGGPAWLKFSLKIQVAKSALLQSCLTACTWKKHQIYCRHHSKVCLDKKIQNPVILSWKHKTPHGGKIDKIPLIQICQR